MDYLSHFRSLINWIYLEFSIRYLFPRAQLRRLRLQLFFSGYVVLCWTWNLSWMFEDWKYLRYIMNAFRATCNFHFSSLYLYAACIRVELVKRGKLKLVISEGEWWRCSWNKWRFTFSMNSIEKREKGRFYEKCKGISLYDLVNLTTKLSALNA